MFCKNCGSELVAGAKFCSECGTKVEELEVRNFDTPAFDDASDAAEAVADEAISAEGAFKERVSFDWSNVIDEPQKKEIPQGIKSPWAAGTGAVDEREIYDEMTRSDDKNRTMSFIDVLKADKEERERAALDRSIEYTEVLELDPELTGGDRPPQLHYAPLYDDVDEPVKTPFDDMKQTASIDAAAFNDASVSADIDANIKEDVGAEPAAEQPAEQNTDNARFELPNFLKKAVGFGAAEEELERSDKEIAPEAPVVDATPSFEPEEAVIEHEQIVIEEPKVFAPREVVLEDIPILRQKEIEIDEAPVIQNEEFEAEETPVIEQEEINIEETPIIEQEEVTIEEAPVPEPEEPAESIYLDEDIYLDLEERTSGTERMSRVDAHTLAGDYDLFGADDSDDGTVEEEPVIEETYSEEVSIGEPAYEAPAAWEPEITEHETEHTSDDEEVESPIDEEDLFKEMGALGIGASSTMTIAAPADEDAEIEELKRRLAELTGTVEIDPEDLARAESVEDIYIETPVESTTQEHAEGHIEDHTEEQLTFEAPETEDNTFESEIRIDEPEFDDFAFEPEITPEDDAFFEGLTPARDVAPEIEQVVSMSAEDTLAMLDLAPPAPILSDAQKDAFSKLNFDITSEPDATVAPTPGTGFGLPESDSPIVGFAPAITESEPDYTPEPTPAVEVPSVETPAVETPIAEPEVSVGSSIQTGLKETDALSLEELEQDLFADPALDAAADAETKKIDKFYTLYRKNEEFQRLLDEEYSRLKGEHIVVPEEDDDAIVSEESAESSEEDSPFQAEKVEELILEDFVTEESKPIEDATIYQERPAELVETGLPPESAQDVATGFAASTAGPAEAPGQSNSAGAAAAAGAIAAAGAAGVASAAGAAAAADDKKDAKADKAAARAAKKEAKAAKKAAKEAAKAAETADPQVEYENVDGGSTILTILAVLVAILLVFLLVVILVLHVAPDSGFAITIDKWLEGIIGGTSAIDTYKNIRII